MNVIGIGSRIVSREDMDRRHVYCEAWHEAGPTSI